MLNVGEIRGLLARIHERIVHTGYAVPQHREDDLNVCVALELLVAMLEREKEASSRMPEKEERESMNNENQSTARLERVARQYVKENRLGCWDQDKKVENLLKDHLVRTAHCQLLPELDKPDCHYIEPWNRKAIEWVYMNMSEDELLHERCRRVLIANVLHILKREESCLVEEPEKKRFRVTYDVKRSGSQDMVVEAENEVEARNLVQGILNKSDASSFANVQTEFIAAEVYEANEEKGVAK